MMRFLAILSIAAAVQQPASAKTDAFGEMQAVFEQTCVATDGHPAQIAAIAATKGWKVAAKDADKIPAPDGSLSDAAWLINEQTNLRIVSGYGPMNGGGLGPQYAESCAALVDGDFGVQAIGYANAKTGRSADSDSVDEVGRTLVWVDMLASGSRILGVKLAGDAETQLNLMTIRAGSGSAEAADPTSFRMLVDLYEQACLMTNADPSLIEDVAKANEWPPVTGAELNEIMSDNSGAKFQAWWVKKDGIRLRVGLRENDTPAEDGRMLKVTSCMTFASGDFSTAAVDYLTRKLGRAPEPRMPGGEFDSLWLEPVGDVLSVHGVRAVQGAQGPISIVTYATLRPKP